VLSCDRLGLIASRRLGGAVVRNRTKRRLREIFRRQQPDRAAMEGRRGWDVVIIARPDVVSAGFADLEADLTGALRRLQGTRPVST
jgi:ribonuclease P protein component